MISPRLMVGNSIGQPPACQTPRFTASAIPRRWLLQWFSSLHVCAIPIKGRPISSGVKPLLFVKARWMKPLM